MGSLRARLGLVAALLLSVGFVSHAWALPKVGAVRAPLKLKDGWERELDLSTINKPLLAIYEDNADGNTNQPIKDDLVALDKAIGWRKLMLQIYVVDLTPYDYWPARGMAKNELQKWSNKTGVILYYDFTDSARASMGFTKALSNVVFYDKSGAVLFAHAGPVPADRRKELVDLVKAQYAALTTPPAP